MKAALQVQPDIPSVVRRTECRLCGSTDLICSVPLAQVPIASPNVGKIEDYSGGRLDQIVAPLDNYLCGSCGLNQLVHVVDPSLIYRDYLYRTSVSMGLSDHFKDLANGVVETLQLPVGSFVVEFGSNDGTLLRHFKNAGMKVQGIDPAQAIASEATAAAIPTIADFFSESIAKQIVADSGEADVIVSNNAMANIDSLDQILNGVRALLKADGVFVFETQYALDVFEKFLLDVIYHEHISTFSVKPVVEAFARYGLEVFDAQRIPTKGGSIRFWVQHKDGGRIRSPEVMRLIRLEHEAGLYDPAYHEQFAAKVLNLKQQVHAIAEAAQHSGRLIAGYGTSVGCAALIHQLELEQWLDCLYDDTPFKSVIEGPGYRLPVHKGENLSTQNPAIVFVLAWRYAKPIMAKQKSYLKSGGRFIVPLPDLSVLSGCA